MGRKTFWDYCWNTLASKGTWIIGTIASAVSIAGFFLPIMDASLRYVIALFFIMLPIIYIALTTAYIIYDDLIKNIPHRPKVITARNPSKYYSASIAVLYTEPTEHLPHGSIVSIYFLVSGFEELIAIGEVINVQDDKKVQVLITYDHDFEKHQNDIMNNDKEALGKIVLKSTIPSFIIPGVLDFG
jgi:hypothetical protein